MISWFSRVFSNEKDAIIDHLMLDPELFESIKVCLQQSNKISESPKMITTVITTAEKLIYLLQGQKLHIIEKNSVETNLLSNFLVPLLITFQIIPPAEAGAVSIIHACYAILHIVSAVPPLPNFSRSFIHICLIQSQYPLLSQMIDFLEQKFLENKEFSESLVDPSFFLSLISEVLPLNQTTDALILLTHNISNIYQKIKIENSYDLTQVSNYYLEALKNESISKNNRGPSAVLYALIVNINNDSKFDFLLLNESKHLLTLIHDSLIDNDNDSLLESFYILGNTPRNNLNKNIMLFIYEKTIRNPVSESSVLVMLKIFYKMLSTKQINFSDFELIFPLHTMLEVSADYNKSDLIEEEIMKIFLYFVDNQFKRIMFCLKPIFVILSYGKKLALTKEVFHSLVTLIIEEKVTPNDYIDSGLFSLFLENEETFGNIVLNYPDFITILRICYKEIDDADFHWIVLKMFINIEKMIDHTTKFSQLCASFFSLKPSENLEQYLMSYILQHPKESLISIFITSFFENKLVSQIFVRVKGLQWVNALVENSAFPEHLFPIFLSSLLQFEAFEEVNTWVTKLPLDHPIFYMEKPVLYHIVFGSNSASPNSLRIPALLPLIPSLNVNLSPHSIYKASKSSLNEFIRHNVDINNNSIVNDMANRYLNSEQFTYLLKNSNSVSSFCSVNSEHFSLFEMTPGTRDSGFSIQRNFNGLSLWFKTETEQNVSLSIFQTDLCSLTCISNSLILSLVNGEKQSLSFESKQWSLISLTYIHEHPKSTIILECSSSHKNIKMMIKTNISELTSVTFGSFDMICPLRWFIGSSIRIYNNTQSIPHVQVRSMGPGSSTPILGTDSETVFTTVSSMTKKGSGALCVPYRGFPWFFQIRKHMVDTIEEILLANTKEKVCDLIKALLNSYILFPNIADFWLQIKTIIKEKSELISDDLITTIFDLFFKKSKDENEFYYMVTDLDVWFLYDRVMLKTLVKAFKRKSIKYRVKNSKLAATIVSMITIKKDNYLVYIKALLKLGIIENHAVFYYHIYNYFITIIYEKKYEEVENVLHLINTSLFKDFSMGISRYFTFENMIKLLANSPNDEISSKYLEFITLISGNQSNYIKQEEMLSLYCISQLKRHDVWIKLLSILSGNIKIDYNSSTIMGFDSCLITVPNIIATIISLIGYSLIICEVAYEYEITDSLKVLMQDVNDMVRILTSFSKHDNELIASNANINIVFFFASLLFKPYILFEESFDNMDSSSSSSDTQINELIGLQKPAKQTPSTPKDANRTSKHKINEAFSSWGFPKHLIDQFKDSNDDSSSNNKASHLYSSILLPVIKYYSPNTKFPLEHTDSLPKYLIDHINTISGFFNIFLVGSQINTKAFASLLKLIAFNTSMADVDGYSVFSTQFTCSLLCSSQIYSAPIQSLEFIFSSIAFSIQNHVFSTKPGILISSCLTVMKALYSIKDQNISKLIKYMRFILNSMFDTCQTDEILEIFEILNSMQDFIYQSHLFDDFYFTSGFLVNLSSFTNNYNDKRYNTFLANLIDKVILEDSFQHSWETHFDSVFCLMLTKYSSGLKILLRKGPLSYADWIKENKDLYMEITKQLETLHREFSSLCQLDDTFSDQNNNQFNCVKFINSKVNSFNKTNSLLFSDFNTETKFVANITTFLKNNHLNHLMKVVESSTFMLFTKNEFAAAQSIRRFKPASFRISCLTLPIRTPRIVCPSNYPLPQLDFDVTLKPENFQQVKCDYFPLCQIENAHDLFPRKYTPILSLLPYKLLPTSYSQCLIDNGVLLLRSLLLIFDNLGIPDLIFNASYLKYNLSVNSVVILFKSAFIVLIGAKYDQTKESIELESTTQLPILYTNLVQMAMLGLIGNCSIFAGHIVIPIILNSICFSAQHYYNHKPLSGVLINTIQGGDMIITTVEKGQTQLPQQFLKAVQVTPVENTAFLHTLGLNQVSNLWQTGHLSSHEYLLCLNSLSGRSFSDLSQYPVFPWVISNYESKDYPTEMRNLSVPMGQIGEERADFFNQTYESQKTHWYGAHYSMAASIHYFLVRIPPFTFFEWDLHQGWDNFDRMFSSMARSWESCALENTNDVKELTPEFYDFPDFLTDVNKAGAKDVDLPPWSKSPEHFIFIMKDCLEAAHIEQWIDLIFGYAQTGQNAINAKNLFMPILYHTYQAKEEDDPQTMAIQLANWGQCPAQLFKKKHNPRTQEKALTNICSDSTLIGICQTILDPLPALNIEINDKMLSISTSSCKMTFDSIDLFDTNFSFAVNCRASSDGTFCVVDFSAGFSIVYKLAGTFSVSTILPFPIFSQESSKIKTSIHGTDLICCTFYDNKIILWDFIRSTIHRIHEFDENIIDCQFDEYMGIIYILFHTSLLCVTINDRYIDKISLPKKGYCLFVQKCDSTEKIRPIFIGLDSGDVVSYYFDIKSFSFQQIMTYKLNAAPIVSLEMRNSSFAIYARDKINNVYCIYTTTMFTPEIIL